MVENSNNGKVAFLPWSFYHCYHEKFIVWGRKKRTRRRYREIEKIGEIE